VKLLTRFAAEVDLNVEKRDVSGSIFRIRYDFDAFSFCVDWLVEFEIKSTQLLQC